MKTKMIKMSFLLALFLTFTYFSANAEAGEQSVQYKDSFGHSWKRWVISEDEGDAGTLLLVTEIPRAYIGGKTVAESTLLRKVFRRSQALGFKKTREFYRSLADQKNHPHAYKDGIFQTGDHQPIWNLVKNSWSETDEADYANWVQNQLNTNFLQNSNFPVDCADFGITVRWVYAHDHGLPAANTLAGSNNLFGQWSGTDAWDSLPTDPNWRKDRRFRAALSYLLDSAYTHTVFEDLYPVELSPQYVTPGAIDLVLYLPTSGHTQVIHSLAKNSTLCNGVSCIDVIWGNEPASETIVDSVDWIVNGPQSEGGFMRWRWPYLDTTGTWQLTDVAQMPGYSLDQYQYPTLDNGDFAILVYQKVGIPLDALSEAKVDEAEFLSILLYRLELTALGQFYCASQDVPSSTGLCDDYSTQARDARLKQAQTSFLASLSPLSATEVLTFQQDLSAIAIAKGYPQTAKDYAYDTDGIMEKMTPEAGVPFYSRWGMDGTQVDHWAVTLADLWTSGWYTRDNLVSQGQTHCFAPGSTTPSCDPADPITQSLDTTLLDEGLRNSRKELVLLLQSADASTSSLVIWGLKNSTELNIAPSEGFYTVFDFLLSPQSYTDKMTSSPLDILEKRYGIQ
jgi:hypothetical protein